MKEILEKAHKRDNFLQISAALLRRKTLAGKQRCEMIKAGEQKEKIVKEWVNVVQLENYSMLFIKMTPGDVAAKASV